MKKRESATQTFSSGSNCAQSVFSAFADDLNIDRNTTLSIASGFGAGMGRTQATCGAVTGAIMVIGMKLTANSDKAEGLNDRIYSKTREFINLFTEKHGTINCRELIQTDLMTEEGQNYFKENNILRNYISTPTPP